MPTSARIRARTALLQNGALLGLPPLVLSLALWNLLPAAYSPAVFGRGIPAWLSFTENVLRGLVFGVPAFLVFGAASKPQRSGWLVYALGLVTYAASYGIQIAWPTSGVARSLLGFSAPAWTTAIWFLGIALVCRESWLRVAWRWWLYLLPVSGFLVFHVTHTILVWRSSRG